MWTWPNILTLARLGAVPFILLAPYAGTPLGWALAFGLFVAAAVTDYLDGALARWLGQSSELGRVLDPIADKLLVVPLLIVLAERSLLAGWHVVPALVIAIREIGVSGLREHLAGRIDLPVSALAKVKTAVQFTGLGLLLAAAAAGEGSGAVLRTVGLAGLWLSAGLTAYTGYFYLKQAAAAWTIDRALQGGSPPDGGPGEAGGPQAGRERTTR